MKRYTILVATMALLLSTFALPAMADDDDPHPAQNAVQCAAAADAMDGTGVYTDAGKGQNRLRTCVITVGGGGSSTWVAASHSQQPWTVEVTSSGGVHTFTIAQGTRTATTTGGSSTVTACKNGSGNFVEDFESNPNCQPAA